MKDKNASLILQEIRITEVAAPRSGTEAGSPFSAAANAVELALVCGMWLLLPLWPLAVAAVIGDRGWVRRYPAALRRIVRHIRALHRSRSIARMLAYRLTRGDRQGADRPSGACSHCGRCCLYRECAFLSFDAQGRSSCGIYGGRLWRSLSCGAYPRHGRDIALFDCPGFSTAREPER